MNQDPIRESAVFVYCSTECKDLVQSLKRGGETYDGLLRRMAAAYDPDSMNAGGEAEGDER
ncbi:hypothetical protein [Halogranum rubrum]|uniref:Uncharacterized protein n=1 Tax=Halogranum salarium B-1 TaxID=1210908 RepID=J3A4R3_9EURY|nr:hypothetical protein [Halogranum salarium]EJN60463.1 hypothetical protein HSB1_10660 [Halogranum salarium B-1]